MRPYDDDDSRGRGQGRGKGRHGIHGSVGPLAVRFPAQTDVDLDAEITSAEIQILGLASALVVSVSNGTWSKNGGAFTALAGTVINGDRVRVRHTSSASELTSTTTTLIIGSSVSPFVSTTLNPRATNYDGIVDYYTRAAPLVGAADSKIGIASFWFKFHSTTIAGAAGVIGNSQCAVELYSFESVGIYYMATDFYGLNGGGLVTQVSSDFLTPLDLLWHHAIMSWDSVNGVGSVYLDDVLNYAASATFLNQDTQFSAANWVAGGYYDAPPIPSSIPICTAECFLDPTRYVDLSVEANRRKFITADRRPNPDLTASNGLSAFGAAPLFYSPRGNGTNVGTGGDLTAVGAPSNCGSNP